MDDREIEKIKKDFPLLQRKMNGKQLVFLDNAASTQKPRQVIEAIKNFYETSYANIHRGNYEISRQATEEYESSREEIARFINAESSEIVFTRNTTESINLVMNSYALNNLKKGDKVVITKMEHNSNILPWLKLHKIKGIKLEWVNLKDFRIDIEDFKEKVKDAKLVAFTHASNVLGTINDVKTLVEITRENSEATVVVDGAQAAPHLKVNVKKLDTDFYAFSLHKMLGPAGVGILYGKKELLEDMEPWMLGGGMVRSVSEIHISYYNAPQKFEAGTPNIEGAIGAREAIKYLRKIGMDNIERHGRILNKHFFSLFEDFKGMKFYGPWEVKERTPLYSFNLEDIFHTEVGEFLNQEGIAVRTGCHCAHILSNEINMPCSVRASAYIYNTKKDLDILYEALNMLVE